MMKFIARLFSKRIQQLEKELEQKSRRVAYLEGELSQFHVAAGMYADRKIESHKAVIASLLRQLELKDKEIAMLQANITNISKP